MLGLIAVLSLEGLPFSEGQQKRNGLWGEGSECGGAVRRGGRVNCRNTSIADLNHHVLLFMWDSGIELRVSGMCRRIL